jgi:hypothetical protein
VRAGRGAIRATCSWGRWLPLGCRVVVFVPARPMVGMPGPPSRALRVAARPPAAALDCGPSIPGSADSAGTPTHGPIKTNDLLDRNREVKVDVRTGAPRDRSEFVTSRQAARRLPFTQVTGFSAPTAFCPCQEADVRLCRVADVADGALGDLLAGPRRGPAGFSALGTGAGWKVM